MRGWGALPDQPNRTNEWCRREECIAMQPMDTTTVVVHYHGPEWWALLVLFVAAVATYDVACWAWDRLVDWWRDRPGADVVDPPAEAPEPIPEPDTSGKPIVSQVGRPGWLPDSSPRVARLNDIGLDLPDSRCVEDGCEQTATHIASAKLRPTQLDGQPGRMNYVLCAHHAARWAGRHGAEVPA